MTDKDREAARRLQDALIDDVMAASDDEIAAELTGDGLDPAAEAASMRTVLARALGKARMTVAKNAIERGRPHPDAAQRVVVPMAANDVAEVRRLTRAARNGKEQSERDIQSAAEDMAELEAFQAEKGKPEG